MHLFSADEDTTESHFKQEETSGEASTVEISVNMVSGAIDGDSKAAVQEEFTEYRKKEDKEDDGYEGSSDSDSSDSSGFEFPLPAMNGDKSGYGTLDFSLIFYLFIIGVLGLIHVICSLQVRRRR